MLAERGVIKNILLLRTLLLIVDQQFSSYRRKKSIDREKKTGPLSAFSTLTGGLKMFGSGCVILISALMNVVILLKISFKMHY